MGVLIDSNLLIVLEREKKDIQKFIASREEEEMFLSVISVSELLHGVHRATTPAIRNIRGAFVESLIRMIPVLEIQSSTARIHADLWASMAKKGTMIGVHDSWIAAQCIEHGLTLVTRNVREFNRVPGLSVEQW
jgi:tRNA(fMet)-specific endonuclease VapC